jgi:hypothetical protein
MDPRPHADVDRANRRGDGLPAPDGPRGTVENRKEPVTDVKAQAAREFPFDRHRYAAAKRQVVEEVLTRAQRNATID